MAENITPEVCRGFRAACEAHQSKTQKLIESAISSAAAMSELKTDMAEKHMETLFAMVAKRAEKNETTISTVKQFIANRFYAALTAIILATIAAIIPIANLYTSVGVNTADIKKLATTDMHPEARLKFAMIDLAIAQCREHVAQSDVLIKKYDSYQPMFTDLIKRVSAIEINDAQMLHRHPPEK